MSTMKNTPQRISRLSRSGTALTSAERWQAVTKRDTTIQNFVYGVFTTKIYCRPSCPARLARRANVEFYDTPSQAEAAGLRPCKRCKPQCDLVAAASSQATMVNKACGMIQEALSIGMKPRLQDLAARVGLTASHFHRVFKKRMGVTPGQYVSSILEGSRGGSSGSGLRTPDSVSLVETPRLDENGTGLLDAGEGLALSGAYEPPVILDAWNAWNEFDVLLAAEQGSGSAEVDGSIDPRIISAT
ncbi:Ada DNA repair metal-binding [Penicillium maclennaniae]|uniref:Ada DNA repair metal-binding n=1 Tax=Penicillium maclennaniae TaxID=1343394 RepID=UPI0025420ABB|nr:Ada DNA repair metal-binding [Penicillium maclennaniae]KAJ5665133.1 Ada DNA repair metal-binding [Penicillium maclennaniae]